ncbi:MAG: mannose-1-phosphate guanylyltransferase [Planctomycetota bacterium]
MLHAVIMAGGSGTRFWPESRRLMPKQLLQLAGDSTMIQSTAARLGGTIPADRQWVLTNEVLVDAIGKQLPGVPGPQILGEPFKRDTAPCIGLAAVSIAHGDPDAILLVLPSDHVIADAAAFGRAIQAGEKLIQQDPTRIVTFGIKPTYPAESFGYIQRGDVIAGSDVDAFDVQRFREKPDRQTATEYLAGGDFYWNSGIFLWRADTILSAMKKNVPEMHARIETIGAAIGRDDFDAVLRKEFEAINGKSIDYAVMEGYPNVAVVEAPFDWDDVGSWQAIARLHPSDEHGNTVVGNHVAIDTTGCIIRTRPDHTVTTIDVDGLIIVQTEDATLVAPKHAEERVREIVKRLEADSRQELL